MAKSVITPPLSDTCIRSLNAGDEIEISGVVYTARDAAHRRLWELLGQNKPLPLDLRGQIIYYTGPTPPQPGHVVGSAGPTTSGRMDKYTPLLLEKTGLKGMIGKGNRDAAVIDAMKKQGCVYFAAVGGAGALIAQCIKKADMLCFEDLGPEAIYRMEMRGMPVIVAIDCYGNSLYRQFPPYIVR